MFRWFDIHRIHTYIFNNSEIFGTQGIISKYTKRKKSYIYLHTCVKEENITWEWQCTCRLLRLWLNKELYGFQLNYTFWYINKWIISVLLLIDNVGSVVFFILRRILPQFVQTTVYQNITQFFCTVGTLSTSHWEYCGIILIGQCG